LYLHTNKAVFSKRVIKWRGTIGNSNNLKDQYIRKKRRLFWEDPWIAGIPISSVAPAVLKMVRPGLRTRLLQDGLPNNAWV
jgi:hypothetical protein